MDRKSWRVLTGIFATIFLVGAVLVVLFYVLSTYTDFGSGPDFGAGAVALGGYVLGGVGLIGIAFVLLMRWRASADETRG